MRATSALQASGSATSVTVAIALPPDARISSAADSASSPCRDVVTTALDIPKQIAFQELPAQQRAISTRLDLAKLKDKHFVEGFVQQYLMKKAQQAADSNTQASLDQLASKAAGLVV